jgi:hypothetical protein
LETCEKTKSPQIRFLNGVFGVFLVFHQPTSEVVCIICERQHKSFKACAGLLVIHGRRLPYKEEYRHSMIFIPGASLGMASKAPPAPPTRCAGAIRTVVQRHYPLQTLIRRYAVTPLSALALLTILWVDC